MTQACLAIAGILALLLIWGAARRSRRRTLRVRHLTDLSNRSVDPDWPRYRSELPPPGPRHARNPSEGDPS